MNPRYVFDACALIAFLNDEEGADKVEGLLDGGIGLANHLLVHEINILEIYYGVYRYGGKSLAGQTLDKINALPIKVVRGIGNKVLREAGRLKATYRISLADSIALAEAKSRGFVLVTCDHHEFDIIEKKRRNFIFSGYASLRFLEDFLPLKPQPQKNNEDPGIHKATSRESFLQRDLQRGRTQCR